MSAGSRGAIASDGAEGATARRFERAVVLGAAAAAFIALGGLLGLVSGFRALGRIRANYIPMAPSTAGCFLILSAALFLHARGRRAGVGHRAIVALVSLVAVFGLLDVVGGLTGLDLTREDWLTRNGGSLGGVPLGRMSSITSPGFVAAGLATLLTWLRPSSPGRAARLGDWASSLGVLTALLGATVTLAYLLGRPLLYGGTAVPMALTTAIAFVFLGIASAAAAGPQSLPLRLFVGESLSARMTRIFLLLVSSALLIQGILSRVVANMATGNDALLVATLIAVTGVITAYTVARMSHGIGARVDLNTQMVRQNAEQHRTIIQTAMDGYGRAAVDGRLLEVNDSFCRMTGYSEAELLAMRIPDLEAAETTEQTTARIRELLARGEGRFETRHRRKDGTVYDVEISVTVQSTDGGQMVAFLRDISVHKLAEESLRASERRLREAQRVARVGSWEVELASGLVIWSESLNRMVGRDPALPAPPLADLPRYYTPGSWARLSVAIQTAATTGEGFELDLEVIREDGGHWWQTARGEAVRSPSGEIVGLHGTVLDVSTRHVAEDAAAVLEAQLRQAQKMETVGRLAGGVAHDFNNMLGVILGHAELAMLQLDSSQPLYTDLTEIHKAAKRSADLTRQLLAYARKQTIMPKVLDLNATVPGVLTMLKRMLGENIELSWSPASNLWPVLFDQSQLDQILTNLCINARDAIGNAGTVHISTTNRVIDQRFCATHVYAKPGEYVQLTVADDGSGMPGDVADHIFEPFFTTKGVGEGTGLGLATVYGIVKQNDGLITVESVPGKGTTFDVYLRRFAGDITPEAALAPAVPLSRGHETVLVVEDEPSVLQMTRQALEAQGYRVLCASGSAEAIRLAAEHGDRIDLLLTDVVMPEMSGRELVDTLAPNDEHLKYLLMSGFSDHASLGHASVADGAHFIQKPFTIAELTAGVRAALDRV